MPNPLIRMSNNAMTMMLKAAAELGLTPSSRSRVRGVAPGSDTPVDPFTAWQRNRRQT
jgi:P27 family predicted phage terminase small subunit